MFSKSKNTMKEFHAPPLNTIVTNFSKQLSQNYCVFMTKTSHMKQNTSPRQEQKHSSQPRHK